MALVTDQEIYDYLGEDDSADPVAIISLLRDGVEAWVQTYCDRVFTVTAYRERYNGDGTSVLILRQYPVTAITRLSLWPTDVIRVKNTNTYTNAAISTSSTAVILTRDGTSTSLLFATYPTFTLLVDAINLTAGWVAALVSPSFASFKSTELIERMGLYCLESNWAYLQMPYQRGEMDFDVDSERGIIHLFRYGFYDSRDDNFSGVLGFPRGTRNIFIDYSAGYATVPEDLKLAIKIIVKYMYQRKDEEAFGARSQSTGGISFTNEGEIPWEAKQILDIKYKKRKL
jgi:hypothetical protein